MDNNQFKEAQDKLNKLAEDKEFSKLMDSRQMVLLHLKQPKQILLDHYFSSQINRLQEDLVYRYINKQGVNVTDIIRGQIMGVQQVMAMKEVIGNYEKLQESVKTQQQGVR